jgi:trans-aconitate 2-methyltransferase
VAWDPDNYLHFGGHRIRPALDLMARVPLSTPERIVDLGCGTGNIARFLKDYWPGARLTGVDSSAEMLARAFADGLDVTLIEADLREWQPEDAPDLIFSNAVLHWCDDHAALFPRLLNFLAPRGVLAIQMPRNHSAPSHTCMTEAARSGPWAEKLEPVLREQPVETPEYYYDVLKPHAWRLDIWETDYMQVLEGDNPVVDWTRGTALKPLLDELDENEKIAFEFEYARRLQAAYPKAGDGKTLFPFKRLFIIAQR